MTTTQSQRQYSEGYGIWYYPLKWEKVLGCHYEAAIQADDADIELPHKCYHLSIEKYHSRKYVVFAEEHNPEDFTADKKEATFTTLREAKAFAQDFAKEWIACQTAIMDADDPADC